MSVTMNDVLAYLEPDEPNYAQVRSLVQMRCPILKRLSINQM